VPPELGEHRRGLEPDIAAADHRDALHVGQLGNHPVDISASADGVDAGEITARAGKTAGLAAGRPDQLAIADRLAVCGGDIVADRIDTGHAPARKHRHLALFPEAGVADQQPLERLLAGEILLGERRALIRKLGLVAEQTDRTGELVLAQRDRRLRTGMARADDQDIVTHARSRSACQAT
jgi:hypothetical protein